jgi:hypothetical protein
VPAPQGVISGAIPIPATSGSVTASTIAKIKCHDLPFIRPMSRFTHPGLLCAFLFLAANMTVSGQFKQTPPAPYVPTAARLKIRTLLQNLDPENQTRTVDTLSGLLVWYRDIIDDEIIAAWKSDEKANLPPLMTPLADARVASAIVEISWRQQRPAAFTLFYAPMLGDLMARYPASAEPFLADLLGQTPDLSPSEAETVCRILLDMPDSGNWKKVALQVLPHYRPAAQSLLLQDLHGTDQEKMYRARFWLSDLKLSDPDAPANDRKPLSRPVSRSAPATGSSSPPRPHIVDEASAGDSIAGGSIAFPYTGPTAGTLKCSGDQIPQNGEYVFTGLPLGNIQIDVGGKPWEARLIPRGQTQDLVIRNIGSGSQKRCTVHWNMIP